MMEDMIRQVEAAIGTCTRWHETGWPATFGVRNVGVPNLNAAEALPKTAVYRDEALNYWRQVRLAGEDSAAWGKKALEALQRGDAEAAGDALYFCQFIEKPFEGHAGTWIPLHAAFRSVVAA